MRGALQRDARDVGPRDPPAASGQAACVGTLACASVQRRTWRQFSDLGDEHGVGIAAPRLRPFGITLVPRLLAEHALVLVRVSGVTGVGGLARVRKVAGV